jgi:hypothetical protein
MRSRNQVLTVRLLVIIVSLWRCSVPVKAQADRFIEAIMYARYADAALRCEDLPPGKSPIPEAIRWTVEALGAAKGFGPVDEERKARLKVFVDQQKEKLTRLEHLQRFLTNLPGRVQRDLEAGRLSSAEALVDTGPLPPCDSGVNEVRSKLGAARLEYHLLIKEGDGLSGRDAASKYRAAQKLDRDNPDLANKIRLALAKR